MAPSNSNHEARPALVPGKEAQETTMKKLSPTTLLGLTAAIALSAGGILVEHPLYTDPAPRAYSDITIAEADNQKVPPASADKTVTPPSPQTVTPANPAAGTVPPAVETTPGEESKGTPPRDPSY